MIKSNVLTETIPGGFSVIISSFLVEALAHMIPWLIACFSIIVCDLVFGIRKSYLLNEKVRFSRAIRATMGKTVTYFAFVCTVCLIGIASGDGRGIEKYCCLLICFIEGCSIIGNILRPKGIDIDMIAAVSLFFKRTLPVNKEDLEDVITKKKEDKE